MGCCLIETVGVEFARALSRCARYSRRSTRTTAYNALMVNEFINLTFQVAAGSLTVPLNGQFFLSFFGLESNAFFLCLYLLILQGTLFYIASGIVLFLRREKR